MPIDFRNIMTPQGRPQANPFEGIADTIYKTQQLAQMRSKMEQDARLHKEEMEFKRLQEGNEYARARLVDDQKKREAEAARLKDARAALAEFSKATGEGRLQEASAMIPTLTAHGYRVELDSEDEGLPRYRITGNGMQDETEGRDNLDINTANGPGIGTTEEAFGRTGVWTHDPPDAAKMDFATDEALARSGQLSEQRQAQAAASREAFPASGYGPGNARPADAPDFNGSVPANVIDTSANQMSLEHRLAPSFGAFIRSRPAELQDSARETAQGVLAAGIPEAKSIEMFDKLQGGPDNIYREQIQQREAAAARSQEAQMAREERANARAIAREDRLAERELSDEDRGDKSAKEAFENRGVDKALAQQKSLDLGLYVLNNTNPNDDTQAATLTNVLMENKGTQTENDVRRALGEDKANWKDVVDIFVTKWFSGGMASSQKDALRGIFNKAQRANEKKIREYLDDMEDNAAAIEGSRPGKAAGLRGFVLGTFTTEQRNKWRQEREARKGKTTSSAPVAPEQKAAAASGKDLIKQFEGKRLEAYPDASGHSIGYGHYGAKPGDKITDEEAERLFDEDYSRFAKVVDEVAPNATPQQRDAMISLAYNIGEQGFRESSVAKQHQAGDYQAAAKAFDLYNKSEGKVNDNLVSRRKKERELYESGSSDKAARARAILNRGKLAAQ